MKNQNRTGVVIDQSASCTLDTDHGLAFPRWVLDIPLKPLGVLSGTAKLFLMALWSGCSADHFYGYPYAKPDEGEFMAPCLVSKIAAQIGLAEESGFAVLRELERSGFVGDLCGGGMVRLAWMVPFVGRDPGYLYVVEFSDGTVKVGKTSNQPKKRIGQHKSAASSFGLSMARSWESERHDRHSDTEAALLAALRGQLPSRNGGEFFQGGFEIAVDAAAKIIKEPR
jgi:hypothetical protein